MEVATLTAPVCILVVGDPGPVRNDILLRRDIDVLWASTLKETLAMIREEKVNLCLVSPLIEDNDEIGAALDRLAGTTCIFLHSPSATVASSPKSARIATVAIDRVDAIRALIEKHTGLPFPKDPRADLRARAAVSIGDETHVVETVNLSASGVAIGGLPALSPGTRAALELTVGSDVQHLSARVVRSFTHRDITIVGFVFVDLGEVQRSKLSRIVDEALEKRPRPMTLDDLFDDLVEEAGGSSAVPLSTVDVTAGVAPTHVSHGTEDVEFPLLRAILANEHPRDIPEWLLRVASELTDVERSVARNEDAPDWAGLALRTRVQLARVRADAESGTLPTGLIDIAYRVFVDLAANTVEYRGAYAPQIGKIRAALLRDILAGQQSTVDIGRSHDAPTAEPRATDS